MTALTWDPVGGRLYETGVDRGVLYIPNNGIYDMGYAWNGLTTVTESPSGAEANPQYADNIKYLNLYSAEEFGCTIEAFTYPDAFGQCDGTATPKPGLSIGQQTRKPFGFSYRTRLGNDVSGTDYGYKIHLVYGAMASPSEKAYATINDSPEAIAFSWDVTTTPVDVAGYKPAAILTIDSTKAVPAGLAALETILYGSAGAEPRLPLPDEVSSLLTGTAVSVKPTAPTATAAGVITITATTGVDYRRADTNAIVTGTVAMTPPIGSSLIIRAYPKAGYFLDPTVDNDWSFTKTA